TGSPVDVLGGLTHTHAVTELVKRRSITRFRAVQVFRFGDDLHAGSVGKTSLPQNAFEWFQITGVNDQQLVLVELHLHGAGCADYRYAGTTIVKEQLLKIKTMALEDG